jgi:hypothetical protein
MTAYGVVVDATDDYVCMGKSAALKCLRHFVVVVVVKVFGPKHLRLPNM